MQNSFLPQYLNSPGQTPNWQGDPAGQPWFGGGGFSGGGLGALAGQMGGYADYLKGLGWDGTPGTRFDFAQGLRQQGQHPFMDYWHSIHPNMGGATQGNGVGGGTNPGGYDGSGINPGGMYGNGPLSQWQQPPHAMPGPMQGVAPMQAPSLPNGLMDLARKKPAPFIQR